MVMGVSGSGKSTIGALLAEKLGLRFLEGDELHPVSNLTKMSSGQPLDDADRAGWLDSVGAALASAQDGAVISCSALKRPYRDRLRTLCRDAWFVHLDTAEPVIASRVATRTEHFMPLSLLSSQFEILEPLQSDEPGFSVDASYSADTIVHTIIGLKGTP